MKPIKKPHPPILTSKCPECVKQYLRFKDKANGIPTGVAFYTITVPIYDTVTYVLGMLYLTFIEEDKEYMLSEIERTMKSPNFYGWI